MKNSLFSRCMKVHPRQHLRMLRGMIRYMAAVLSAVILSFQTCTTSSRGADISSENIVGYTTDSVGGVLAGDVVSADDYSLMPDANGHATLIEFNSDYAGGLSISNTVNGCRVVAIAENAFTYSTNLTSITFPESVTNIDDGAFSRCLNLTAINIDARNPCYASKDGILFNKNLTKLVVYPRGRSGSVTIPSQVESIGRAAFFGCTSLSRFVVDSDHPKFTVENGVLFDKTKHVLIAYASDKTGSYAIPVGVKEIGDYAFSDHKGLKNIIVPDGVTLIGAYAFSNCAGLTGIPGSVTNILSGAFSGCTGLTSITISDGVTTIPFNAFGGCTSLTSITIPDSVSEIGGGAFSGCTGLTSITIPDSVTEIGCYAFSDCTGLTGIYFEGDAPSIGSPVIKVGSPVFNDGSTNATIYYRAGTKGWGATFGERPTAVWKQ